MSRRSKKINLKRKNFLENIHQYAINSSIHGVSYIFDRSSNFFDRLFWFILFSVCIGLSIFLTISSYSEWKKNQVITSLKTVAKPVAEIDFPAVTICGAGQHMDTVERVLLDNFREWEVGQPVNKDKNLEEKFADYMREVFMITKKGMSIMDVLNTILAPNEEASTSNAVRKNEIACAKEEKRKKNNIDVKGE